MTAKETPRNWPHDAGFGYTTPSGQPYSAAAVASMLGKDRAIQRSRMTRYANASV
jgi:hypothetical protein